VLVAIGEACPVTIEQATAEVQAAAAGRLGVILSDHDVVMKRAKAAVAKLDAKLAAAQSAGLLSAFNREFKNRRLRANAAGARFMSYAEAHRRLRKALAAVAADGSVPALMQHVFGDTRMSARVAKNQKIARCPARASP
jgi:hypothetical protein